MAEPSVPEPAHQSLYRRFRPQRFDEVRGQDHVTTALRNAVRDGRSAHAYLFSGPRGTGKTSTARILAKALNCEAPDGGEPCGTCPSCVQVQRGASLDVIEIDAATNSKVEEMRDLLSRVALGSPGRWKVYIVDEVHMLSPGASNALLKTLEEPPGHVVFVLATTDPQKVLPTIKSRTQHFEFRLLPQDVLGGLVRDVSAAAGIDLPDEALAVAARKGAGSARDALSVLDQVAAAGGVEDDVEALDDLVEALCDRDVGRALRAVDDAVGRGRDVRTFTTQVIERLREAFLAGFSTELVAAPDDARDRLRSVAQRLGTGGLVRAIEVLGRADIDMRDAVDARVTLEVAVVRLADPESDTSPAALLERIERLERQLARLGEAPAAPAPAARPAPRPPDGAAPEPATAPGATPPSPGSKPSIGALKRRAAGAGAAGVTGVPSPPPPPAARPAAPERPAPAAAAPAAAPAPVPAPAAASALPDRDQLTKAWGDTILAALRPGVKARYSAGRFLAVDGDRVRFGVPNQAHAAQCEPLRGEVEAALGAHFGVPVRIELVVDGGGTPQPGSAPPPPDDDVDVASLVDATDVPVTPEERLLQAFPGAQEVGDG